MTRSSMTLLDELWRTNLPAWSLEEQRAGLVLLRELAKGAPVGIGQLAGALRIPVRGAHVLVRDSALKAFMQMGQTGEIVGFLGLSTIPTTHRFTIDGRSDDRPAWTWCAQDSLFLPELLGETARIESRDPESGAAIRLTVSPTRVETVEPKGAVVSMMASGTADLASAAGVIATVCHFIFFFASRASGERWAADRPGTVLLSLDEAFACGKRQNALLFRASLARRRRATV